MSETGGHTYIHFEYFFLKLNNHLLLYHIIFVIKFIIMFSPVFQRFGTCSCSVQPSNHPTIQPSNHPDLQDALVAAVLMDQSFTYLGGGADIPRPTVGVQYPRRVYKQGLTEGGGGYHIKKFIS